MSLNFLRPCPLASHPCVCSMVRLCGGFFLGFFWDFFGVFLTFFDFFWGVLGFFGCFLGFFWDFFSQRGIFVVRF